MQKKLMLLGGIRYLLPAIEVAHKYGHKVITVDYLPDNIAHKFSDEYYNVSILDKEAVLKLARELKIDGILSYAVDPGVVTAAYVAEQMGFPFSCSYNSTCILQDKAMFRQYLRDNGFNVPNAKGYIDLGMGKLVHDMNGFKLTGRYKDEDYEVVLLAKDHYSVHIEYEYLGKFGDCVDLNTLNDTFYVYPKCEKFSVTKMSLACEELFKLYNPDKE